MKSLVPVRTFLIRAAGLGVCVGCALALGPRANAAEDAPLSVESTAPLQATLLPTVSISSSIRNPERVAMHVAATPPLAVTLLPTVHVNARWIEPVGADERATELPSYAAYATDTSRRLACFEENLSPTAWAPPFRPDPMSR